jgi:hypothetical protein
MSQCLFCSRVLHASLTGPFISHHSNNTEEIPVSDRGFCLCDRCPYLFWDPSSNSMNTWSDISTPPCAIVSYWLSERTMYLNNGSVCKVYKCSHPYIVCMHPSALRFMMASRVIAGSPDSWLTTNDLSSDIFWIRHRVVSRWLLMFRGYVLPQYSDDSLKMEVICSSETLALTYHITRLCNREYRNINLYYLERSCIIQHTSRVW